MELATVSLSQLEFITALFIIVLLTFVDDDQVLPNKFIRNNAGWVLLITGLILLILLIVTSIDVESNAGKVGLIVLLFGLFTLQIMMVIHHRSSTKLESN